MRVRPFVLALLLALSARAAAADPVTAPGSTWGNGEGRKFELLWNGAVGTFEVEGVGTSVYDSLDHCCSDVFDRVRDVNPGSSLTFSGLVLNWYAPISTVIQDDLDWALLKASGFDNLISLTGLVTLTTDPRARRGVPMLAFNAKNDDPPVESNDDEDDSDSGHRSRSIPEPGTLMLVGSGLLGVAAMARRRMARAGARPAGPAAR